MSEVHQAVLRDEVIAALAPADGEIMVDATFGAGGYSAALLAAAECRVIGIDRDPAAIARGADLSRRYPGRLHLVEGRFGDMDRHVRATGAELVHGVAMDLGVSSPQLDEASRGFSFRFDGPLDMRMGRTGPTAADIVNETPEKDLADLIYRLGEERRSRQVAAAIVARRRERGFVTTLDLADAVRKVVRRSNDGIDPATRTFQALRLAVNDELGELDRGLAAAERLLGDGGRLAVVSFHSLEDRQVKRFLSERSGSDPRGSRHQPDHGRPARPMTFVLDRRRAIQPSDEECRRNPRARSARLRVARRTAQPAVPAQPESAR